MFPAHAGMTPGVLLAIGHQLDAPRACGDDPARPVSVA